MENIPLTATHSRNVTFSTYKPRTICEGGFYSPAFDAVAKAGGVTTDAAYPYDITVNQCDVTKNDYIVTVTKYNEVVGQQNMINHILYGGALAVVVDASMMSGYTSGIFNNCPATRVNQGVQIVGVNVDEGYWIIRNSSGKWWGDKGYMKLALVRPSPVTAQTI